jgi:hypothetical protein
MIRVISAASLKTEFNSFLKKKIIESSIHFYLMKNEILHENKKKELACLTLSN